MALGQRQTSEVAELVNWAFKMNYIMSNYKCECGPGEAPVVMCGLLHFVRPGVSDTSDGSECYGATQCLNCDAD